jgi:hypothetical protein
MAVMLGCAVGHTSRINFLILPETVTWIFVIMIAVDLKNTFPSIGSQLLWLQLLPSAGETSNKILFLLPMLCLSILPFGEAYFFSHYFMHHTNH